MVLIPPESVQIGASISSKVSQTPFWVKIWGPVSTFIDTSLVKIAIDYSHRNRIYKKPITVGKQSSILPDRSLSILNCPTALRSLTPKLHR
jgi:hypothetical protein